MGKPFCIWCEVGNHRGCVKQARYLSAEGVVLEASCGCYPLHAHPGPITEPVPTEAEDQETEGEHGQDQAEPDAEDSS